MTILVLKEIVVIFTKLDRLSVSAIITLNPFKTLESIQVFYHLKNFTFQSVHAIEKLRNERNRELEKLKKELN